MANIGAEVGQKMRSAIKAKLLELNCYVDDELPDYVMVMVANKRTKSQMKEDLQLFLNTKTATFVDWLHIVLKKLKEVTVTNPEVYKKTSKRKSDEILPNIDMKKEKKDKRSQKNDEDTTFKSLTDDLPINANKLSEQRKIIIMRENQSNNSTDQDSFDIPLLSEVNMSTEEELEDIERKIKGVKSRLGLMVESDEDFDDCIDLKPEPDELFDNEDKSNDGQTKDKKGMEIIENDMIKKPERARITFDPKDLPSSTSLMKRKSILERLGTRRSDPVDFRPKRCRSPEQNKKEEPSRSARKREEPSRSRRERDKPKEPSVLSRLGVMSKVSIPPKAAEEPEEQVKNREVPSMVKIKPRILPLNAQQPNKNLLLKAVADAQRSIAQTPQVGSSYKPDALFTKNYKKDEGKVTKIKRLSKSQKDKLAKLLLQEVELENAEYVPEPLSKKNEDTPEYIPTTPVDTKQVKHQFIVTLDGIEKTKFKSIERPSIRSRLEEKKSPSPIIFDKVGPSLPTKSTIPDKLPVVQTPASVKNKERCRYWPQCRQGEKCEFVHPATTCDKFPHCKFGEKCLYLHPQCKFKSSCTRRDCPYSHNLAIASTTGANGKQICKYFPNCVNASCSFYHPTKLCKFGKYCKNQSECNYSHGLVPTKGSLTWRSK